MHGQFRGFLRDDGCDFEDEGRVVVNMRFYLINFVSVCACMANLVAEKILGASLKEELYRTLKDKFGFNSFRHRQKPAITAILKGMDAFVLMPTGE